jgi:RNA polymerase sigma factor (sigma-70 family)
VVEKTQLPGLVAPLSQSLMPNETDQDSPTSNLESTTLLLARVREGDEAARNRLMERFWAPLHRWAHGRLPRKAAPLVDTDDLVQNALLRSLDHIEAFESRREGAFLAYLRKILMNLIRDEARRVARQPAQEELPENLADGSPSPLEETVGNEALARYEAALARLPEVDQEVVMLRLELGFSYPQVAEAIGSLSPNAARMRVVRAVMRLAEELT